jgi:hypothetical protein
VSPVISTSRFPFLEGQTGKSIYCSSSDYGNPTAIATWTAQFGTPDSADTRKLRLPKLKCQLQNFFTQSKGLQIQSKQVRLQVECKRLCFFFTLQKWPVFKNQISKCYHI